MKTIILLAASAIMFAASSCSKCTTCTKANEPDVRYCEKDFDSNTAYGLAIDIKEADGFNCSSSL